MGCSTKLSLANVALAFNGLSGAGPSESVPSGATGAGQSGEHSKGSKVSEGSEEPEIVETSEVEDHARVHSVFVQALSEWWSLHCCCYLPILS